MTTVRNVILGCIVVMVANTFQLAHITFAKYQSVTPGQIVTARGLLQILTFGTWAIRHRAAERLEMEKNSQGFWRVP